MRLLALAVLLCVSSSACEPRDNDQCYIVYDPLKGDGYYLMWFEPVKK